MVGDRIKAAVGALFRRERKSDTNDRIRALESALDKERTLRRRGPPSKASGVRINMGRFGYEDNDDLRGKNRYKTLTTMARDAHVKGTLRFNALPLIDAEWKIKPASEDPRDIDIADFVAANLLRKSSKKYGRRYWLNTPWEAQRLPEILTMLQFGFSLFDSTWRTVDDKQVFDTMKWLEPTSLDSNAWDLDDSDNILGVWRTYNKPSGEVAVREYTPASNLVLYVWEMMGARYEGEPLIRSLYGAHSRKDQYLHALVAWANKAGNPVPIGIIPSKGYSDDEIDKLERLVEMMRDVPPQEAWGVLPRGDDKGPTIEYVSPSLTEADRIQTLVNAENAEMSHGGGTKSMLLGETRSGSRALGDSIGRLEAPGVGAVVKTVIEWESHGVGNLPGPIQALVDRNFNDVEEYPTLVCDYEDPISKRNSVAAISQAAMAKLIPTIPEVQQQVTKRFGIDLPLDTFKNAQAEEREREMEMLKAKSAAKPKPTPGAPTAEPETPEETDTEEESVAASALADMQTRLLPMLEPVGPAPGNGMRSPNKLEAQCVDLAAITGTFTTGEAAILGELRNVHRAAIDEFVKRARDGKVTKRNIDGLRRSKFKAGEKLTSSLIEALRGVGETGASHVADEIERQRKTTSLEMKRISGHKVPAKYQNEFASEMSTLGAFDIGAIWNRVVEEGIGEFLRGSREGVDAEMVSRLENFLKGLSEKPLNELAVSTTSVAYNQGRDMGIKTAKDAGLSSYAVRSEVLDKSTCDTCRVLDGKTVGVDTPAYYEYMPPNKCLGRERCRGFYVPLLAGGL